MKQDKGTRYPHHCSILFFSSLTMQKQGEKMHKWCKYWKVGKCILFTDSIINIEIPRESTYDLIALKCIQQIFGYQIHFISVHKLQRIKSTVYKIATIYK